MPKMQHVKVFRFSGRQDPRGIDWPLFRIKVHIDDLYGSVKETQTKLSGEVTQYSQ